MVALVTVVAVPTILGEYGLTAGAEAIWVALFDQLLKADLILLLDLTSIHKSGTKEAGVDDHETDVYRQNPGMEPAKWEHKRCSCMKVVTMRNK